MDNADRITAAASAASAAGKVSLGGGTAMVIGGLTVNEWAMVGGLIVGLLGFAVQWYYRHREFKLRERESNARLAERGYYE